VPQFLTVLCLSMMSAAVSAQSVPPLPRLETDARVRVWSESSEGVLKARVRNITPETLALSAGTNESRVFQAADLERIDLSRGRNRWVWTLGGMLVGATAGVIISRADNDDGDTIGGIDETAEGLANTVTGALVGGAIGFFVAPERWRTVWRRQ
jgi:hypothetical protein